MRKLELGFVILSVAVATAWWTQKGPTQTPHAKMMTRSGRFEVLPSPYGLAGLTIGCDESEAVAARGQPSSKADEDKETHTWSYSHDGQDLHLVFLEDRLISVGGQGRWGFSKNGQRDSTLFTQTQDQIRHQFGVPDRVDASAWVYNTHPGELTVHFDKDSVTQVYVVGEIKPTPK